MKKTFFWAALCLMNVALTAQEDYELRTLTFEDTDYRGTAVRFTGHSTALPHTPITSSSNSQKILRNGQLIILREGKCYSITGQEL